MSSVLPGATEEAFEEAARRYEAAQTLEDIMEGWNQAYQRSITVSTGRLMMRRIRQLHMFNEMLVQYLRPGDGTIQQVCPDNMIVRGAGPFDGLTSFNVPLQPVGPFMVMEYVSPGSERKDYEVNLVRYERDLRVPYCLLFNPEAEELILYRHDGERYAVTPPGPDGLYPVPELDMHVGVLDCWLRFWHAGRLLPLPEEMDAELEAERGERADSERQREEAERQRADAERQREKAERQRADAERLRQDAERRRDEEQRLRLKAERDREDAAVRQTALEAEVARLRALLAQPPAPPA